MFRFILGSLAAIFTDRHPNRTCDGLKPLYDLDFLFKRQVREALPPLLFRAKDILDCHLARIEFLAAQLVLQIVTGDKLFPFFRQSVAADDISKYVDVHFFRFDQIDHSHLILESP
jgi:hypothetical protein